MTKRPALLALSLFSLSLLACAPPATGAGAATPATQGGGDGAAQGAPATDFTLRDVDGKNVSLTDHGGKVVVMVFWATWCVPCHAQLPLLEKMYQQYKDQGFVVLGISMDGPETVAGVAPDVRRYQLTFPVLLDEETRVTSLYNPKRTAPLTLLIDQQGRISRVRQGFNVGDERLVEADVKELLAKK